MMKDFNRINNLVGWLVFAVAFVVYALTVEQTASFWDCGEFIAVSYKLMVPHPPGAPFYLLLGRLFSFLAMGDVMQVSYWINMLSVTASAFTILFLFWTIVLFGRKIVPQTLTGGYSPVHTAVLMASGVVGSLAYTFSDSFWFSAVEAEVYALSSFFTAIVIWAMMKWDLIEDDVKANKWLLFIAYMMGLSIGVHLLNLVAIPALALIYYFKKFRQPTTAGLLAALGVGGFIILVVMYGVIPGIPSMAGTFEIAFVNDIGLPFGSGMFFFLALFLGTLVYGIYFTQKRGWEIPNLSLLSLAFILIGYASYGLVIVRSQFDPPIDENDPENLISFVSYLKREQYGDRPLFYGPTFDAKRDQNAERDRARRGDRGEPVYRKGKENYEVYDYRIEPLYEKRRQMLLPRIYSQQSNHPDLYRSWIGLGPNDRPTMADNIAYMFGYQFGHMYFRYFMWNFAGRDGDEKESGWLYPWEGSENAPHELANNKSRSNFYMIPLLVGLIGAFFQAVRDPRNFWVNLLLFFLMGLGLVLYLNSPPVEPRERDYIYVGSFYAFSIWIGMGTLAMFHYYRRLLGNNMASVGAAAVVSAIAPVLMGVNGWDNHNRSNRFHSVDQARNTLRSCAPNAILFTGGDNDTFPLWYVQNVEGFRTDVRVVVLSYFSTDWYIKQTRQQHYDSPPVEFMISQEGYRQGHNDYVPLVQETENPLPLEKYMELIAQDNPRVQVPLMDGSQTAKLISPYYYLDIDSTGLIASGLVPKGKEKQVVGTMFIGLREGRSAIFKNDLAILDLMAVNNRNGWKRPIYFNNTSAATTNLELRNYLQVEGMAYRLLPIRKVDSEDRDVGEVSTDLMLANLRSFEYRGFEDPNTFHDEEYRKFGSNARSMYHRLAYRLYNEGRKEEAKEVLDMALERIPDASIPYSYFMPRYVELYHLLGEHERAQNLADTIGQRAEESLEYIIEWKKQPMKGNKMYDYMEQKSLMVVNQLAYIYRDLATAEANRSRSVMAGADSLSRAGEVLEGIRAREAEFRKRYERYATAFGQLQDGLRNPERYQKLRPFDLEPQGTDTLGQ
jgi:tetratricopeptide (TPR) repeat protein